MLVFDLFVSSLLCLDALSDECKWDNAVCQPGCGIRSRVTMWTVGSPETSLGRHRKEGPKHGEEEGESRQHPIFLTPS